MTIGQRYVNKFNFFFFLQIFEEIFPFEGLLEVCSLLALAKGSSDFRFYLLLAIDVYKLTFQKKIIIT